MLPPYVFRLPAARPDNTKELRPTTLLYALIPVVAYERAIKNQDSDPTSSRSRCLTPDPSAVLPLRASPRADKFASHCRLASPDKPTVPIK